MPWNNPWAGLSGTAATMYGRRVEAQHPREWFWCMEPGGRYGLALYGITRRQLSPDVSELQGLSVSILQKSDGAQFLLLLLESGADWELFRALCLDLVESTEGSATPDDALDIAITRLHRWRRLLSRGGRPGLTDEEVRGLLAELIFLRDELTPRVGDEAAILGWAGPHGHPQDFAVGERAFEIKSHLASARQVVEITSAEQLESTAPVLFLVVQDLSHVQDGMAGSTTLSQVVKSIRNRTIQLGKDFTDRFEDALDRQGYEDGRRYGEIAFIDSGRRYYRVAEGFPRIVRSRLAGEISRVRYALDVSQCGKFYVADPWM